MARTASVFRQVDVTRVLRAIAAAEMTSESVDIMPDGKIRIMMPSVIQSGKTTTKASLGWDRAVSRHE